MTRSGAKHNFTIEKGVTFQQTITITATGTTTPLDLTGYTGEMDVRVSPYSESESFTFTTDNGRMSITGASGVVGLTMSATDTAALTALPGTYNLLLTDTSTGTVIQPLYGDIEVVQTTTR